MKTCSKCKVKKPKSKFHKDKCKKDGLRCWCKKCMKQYCQSEKFKSSNRVCTKKWRQSEKGKRYHKKYYQSNKVKHREYMTVGVGFTKLLKNQYGITLKQYNEMLEKQNGLCAICGCKETAKNPSGGTRRLSIDHDHKTGKLRGLLCNNCNHMLGAVKDNISTLLNAVSYLRKLNVNTKHK